MALQAFSDVCSTPAPDWVGAAVDPQTPWTISRLAAAFRSYRDPQRLAFVHLQDGGLTDYLALAPMLAARLSAERPFEPLAARDAVRISSLTVAMIDVGQAPIDNWPLERGGPDGQQAIEADFGAAMAVSMRFAHDAFAAELRAWQAALRDWRCGLDRAEVRRLRGTLDGWRCDGVTIALTRVSFDDLPPHERAALAAVETRLSLPRDQTDRLIAGGRAAALANPVLRALTDAGR